MLTDASYLKTNKSHEKTKARSEPWSSTLVHELVNTQMSHMDDMLLHCDEHGHCILFWLCAPAAVNAQYTIK